MQPSEPQFDERAKERRLFELEQALKRDPDREYRREIVREYLALTEPEPKELDF